MKIEVYSKDNCPWCVKALEIINNLQGVNVTVYKLNVDYVKEELAVILPEGRKLTVPQIFIDEKYIGDHDDFVAYLEETSGGYGDGGL